MEWEKDDICYITENCDAETMIWAIENGCPYKSYMVPWAAAASTLESIDKLEYLKGLESPPQFTPLVWLGAINSGQIDVLEWIKQHMSSIPQTTHCYSQAIASGHVEVYDWLKDNGYPSNGDTCQKKHKTF